MKNSPPRIIVDTNLWVSFLISTNYTKLDKILFDHQAILIFSKELLDEFLTVIKRPKLSQFFSEQDVEELLEKYNHLPFLLK